MQSDPVGFVFGAVLTSKRHPSATISEPPERPRSRLRGSRSISEPAWPLSVNASGAPESFWLQSVRGAPKRALGALADFTFVLQRFRGS
eukprot:574361-Alexandrium_andersonii.AAC.1